MYIYIYSYIFYIYLSIFLYFYIFISIPITFPSTPCGSDTLTFASYVRKDFSKRTTSQTERLPAKLRHAPRDVVSPIRSYVTLSVAQSFYPISFISIYIYIYIYIHININKENIYTRILGPPKADHTTRHKTLIILKSILREKLIFIFYKCSKISNVIWHCWSTLYYKLIF